MNIPKSQHPDQTDTLENTESEISLLDIIDFVQSAWKKLAIAAVVGAILGLAYWFLLVGYTAQLVLLNNNNNNNSYALDIVSWRTVQKSLPNLAAQIVVEGGLKDQELSQYRTMSDELWWQKNVLPTYALSKADTKDLAAIGKDLDGAATTILSLTINSGGATEQKSVEAVKLSGDFLRSGSAYLQLRGLINGYESNATAQVAEINRRITSAKIDLQFLNSRVQNLEELRKRFPQNTTASSQVVDAKDSGAKYLPITIQIIAVNNDINGNKELLDRMQIKLAQIGIINNFLSQALPLMEQSRDGLMFAKQLLDINSVMLQKVSPNDPSALEALQGLRSEIVSIQNRFTKSLEANSAPTSKKRGMIKSAASGLAVAFFLALMVLLGQRVWASVKASESSPIKPDRSAL